MDENTGYSGLAAYAKEMQAAYGEDRVTLVDAGDAIQGDVIGTLSDGQWPVDIMNALGYDIFVPGNHEFDYGMKRMLTLMEEMDAQVLSCNFIDLKTGKPVFDPYAIVDYGDTKIAFVGITTPESFSKTSPAYFQDENGNFIYSLCEGEEGKELYDAVQKSVDAAISQGADYVIAVGHLGETSITDPWKASAVIANTTGIDVLIDGHSHEQIVSTAKNQDGEEVIWCQTGTKLSAIGKILIDPQTGSITHQLITGYEEKDPQTEAFLETIRSQYEEKTQTVVAQGAYTLTTMDPDTGQRAIRNSETNLGDFCADAYRYVLDADVAFVNGGGIRADLPAGNITYGDIIAVHPYGNEMCLVEATGQEILDALELGAADCPLESGGFLHVSGMRYTIDTSVPSSVVTNLQGEFLGVEGAYRVKDVFVGDQPLDPQATYRLASHSYFIKEGGDGFNMFTDNNLLLDCVMLDNQALIDYAADYLGGVIGKEYANPRGQGRITIYSWPSDVRSDAWYGPAVSYVWENRIMSGAGDGAFAPSAAVSRAMVYQSLYQLAGAPQSDPSSCTFTDIEGRWFASSAAWAQSTGISAGLGQGRYGGDQPVTRQELAKIFTGYAQLMDMPLEEASLEDFSDAASAAGWSLEAMEKAVGSGLISGIDGRLSPSATATRAQLAQILLNLHSLQEA